MPMKTREKQAVTGGLLLLAMLAVYTFMIRRMERGIRDNEAAIETSDQALTELAAKSEDYHRLRAALDRVHERVSRHTAGVGAVSALEGIEKECGLSRGVSMTPEGTTVSGNYAQTKVTIGLEGITLDQALAFLQRIETADVPMGVRSLMLKRNARNATLLDATIEVVSVAQTGKV